MRVAKLIMALFFCLFFCINNSKDKSKKQRKNERNSTQMLPPNKNLKTVIMKHKITTENNDKCRENSVTSSDSNDNVLISSMIRNNNKIQKVNKNKYNNNNNCNENNAQSHENININTNNNNNINNQSNMNQGCVQNLTKHNQILFRT